MRAGAFGAFSEQKLVVLGPWKGNESFFFESIAKVFDATLGTLSKSLRETKAIVLSPRFDVQRGHHGQSIEASMRPLILNGRH